MRIERTHHAAYGFLHELVIIHVVHIFALDARVDFREQTGVFPGKRGSGSAGLCSINLSARRGVAGQGASYPQQDPCSQSGEGA